MKMITLMKAKKHSAFDQEVKMAEKIVSWLNHDLSKVEIIRSDLMSEEFNDYSFAIRVADWEIYYDPETLEYVVFEEHYYAGNYWNPPDIDMEQIATFSTFAKALEVVIQKMVTKNISGYMEGEYERYLDSLPQGDWYGA
jgi:hypothetical protein